MPRLPDARTQGSKRRDSVRAVSLGIALALSALIASIYLALRSTMRPWAFAAAAASGIQLAVALGWLSIRIANIPLLAVIAVVVAGCGGVIYARVGAKGQVTAATVVALVGAIGVASTLGLFR
jgi:hypothetical protein